MSILKKVWYIDVENVPEERCSGCGICEVVCSLSHEGVINPKKSRIRVVSHLYTANDVYICRHCGTSSKPPPCVESCPNDAFDKRNDTLFIVNKEKCTGCGDCVEACSFNAMFMNPKAKVAISCDLCSGDPLCVKYCPPKVLHFKSSLEIRDIKAQAREKKKRKIEITYTSVRNLH